MRPRWSTGLLVTAFICSMVSSSPVSAKTAGYCLECHCKKSIETFSLQTHPLPGQGRSVYQMKLDGCPGLRTLAEETFFTEGRIVKLGEITRTLEEEGWNTESLKKGIAESARSFSDLKEGAMVSSQPFSQQTSAIRASLQKVYERTVKARDESNRRWLIGLGILFFVGLLVLVGIGYLKVGRMRNLLLVCFLAGSVFSLSSCTPSTENQKKSPDQEKLDQALSLASQVTRQMEEVFYRSVLLGEMSREWSRIEPAAAQKGFELAWRIAQTARQKAAQIKPLGEIASKWPNPEKASQAKVHFDAVLDLRDELRQAEGRTWPLRAIAEAWVQVDPRKGRLVLELATGDSQKQRDPQLRDQELKTTAEAWAGIDGKRSLEVGRSIGNPYLKAMALSNVASSARDRRRVGQVLQEAWAVAETIPASYAQSEALIQVSVAAARLFPQDKNAWLSRVLLQIQGLTHSQLKAFGLLKLVDCWASLDPRQAKRLAMEIPVGFPAERAFALLRLAKNREVPKAEVLTLLKEASAEMRKISDPFELQKMKALNAMELIRTEPRRVLPILPQIKDSFHRSEVLEALALRLSREDRKIALQLAERIPFGPIRERCRVAIINQRAEQDRKKVEALYGQTLKTAEDITDPSARALVLIELGKSWRRVEEGMETEPWESALKSAERIASPSIKAEVLEVLAEAWKGVDPAKSQSILRHVDPSLLRARTIRSEVERWTAVDPQQAVGLAETIASQYPVEKAMAFKAIGGSLKKEQPRIAFSFLEKAIDQILALPRESRGRELLSSLASEAGRVDQEKTLQLLVKVSEPETRDLLLRDCGNLWAEENPLLALKTANEISDGAIRLVLYQKIADAEARKVLRGGKPVPEQPSLRGCFYWGIGRERATREESQAVTQYEKALHEIRSVSDAKERSYLLTGLAAEWVFIDEERSLLICGEISPEFSESLSFGLFQIGAQLKKWNRERADALFQKTFAAAEKIQDSRLRAVRFWQIGQQWQSINRGKGREVLKRAASEIRKRVAATGKEDPVLIQILTHDLTLDPQGLSTLFEKTDSAEVRARVLLERGKAESRETVEENINVLERAFQFGQKTRQGRLLSDIALASYALNPERGLRVCSQIDSKALLIQTYCQMIRISGPLKKGESKRLLEKALQEVALIEGVTEKMEALKTIAGAASGVDSEQAKSAYRSAYRIMEESSP